MGNFLFMGLVHLFRLHKLREWVIKKEGERADALRAEGYERGYGDGVSGVSRHEAGAD